MTYFGETMTFGVVRLKRSQINEVSEILANAFSEDPMFRHLIGETEPVRANILNKLFKITLRYYLPYKHIYTTVDSLKGVAVWLPPEYPNPNFFQVLSTGLCLTFQIGLSRIEQFMSIFSILDEHHQRDMPEPHWHLNILGVSPADQRQGIGSSLLQPILQHADSKNLPCYLETSTEKAVRFYQKNGFEVLKTIELPEGSPLVWTMKREPLNNKNKSQIAEYILSP